MEEGVSRPFYLADLVNTNQAPGDRYLKQSRTHNKIHIYSVMAIGWHFLINDQLKLVVTCITNR